MMARDIVLRLVGVSGVLVALTACAVSPPAAPASVAPPTQPSLASLPEAFESDDFVLTFAKAGDTPERLAERFLGDPAKAWMIEDYNGTATWSPGQEVIIPKRPWNLAGVTPTGYQLVPVLVYHNIGPQARGRLVIAVQSFREQIRYLKDHGYRVVSLKQFLEFTSLERQLPKRTVVLTFDDGWKSFKEYAYPILKEVGFPATLFIYTDFVGARSALSWTELRELAEEGFDVEAHSKTHGDFRRRPGEPDAEYARRMQAELTQPLGLFQRYLGQSSQILAYPYGSHDDEVMERVRAAGYQAAFDVRREGNPAFGKPYSLHRSQIYSEMTLDDFAKNLNVFNEAPIR